MKVCNFNIPLSDEQWSAYLLGAFETERLGRRSATYAQFFDDHLILPNPHEIVINHDFPPSSHVRLGIIGIGEVRTLLWAAAAELTPPATWHLGPEFGSEQTLHQPGCLARIELRDELFRCIAPIDVDVE